MLDATGYPPARYCPLCRTLDAGLYPRESCCGQPTIPPPDYMQPKPLPDWATRGRKWWKA